MISYITCKRYAYDFLTQAFALNYGDAINVYVIRRLFNMHLAIRNICIKIHAKKSGRKVM